MLVEREDWQFWVFGNPAQVPRVQAYKPVEQPAESPFVETAPGSDTMRDVIHQHPAFTALVMEGNIYRGTR
jgi:hypothetical protein